MKDGIFREAVERAAESQGWTALTPMRGFTLFLFGTKTMAVWDETDEECPLKVSTLPGSVPFLEQVASLSRALR